MRQRHFRDRSWQSPAFLGEQLLLLSHQRELRHRASNTRYERAGGRKSRACSQTNLGYRLSQLGNISRWLSIKAGPHRKATPSKPEGQVHRER